MKKFLLLFSILFNSFLANSQCQVTATSTSNQVICGDCVDLNAIGISGNAVLDNDFDNGTVGSGWATTPGAALFTNPCDPSFDGGTYIWMGSATAGARNLVTTNFDLSCGGQVCFWLDYATQGGTGDCEGPDLATEGVYFQYSIDGGVTWITIQYFDPLGGFDPQMTSWNQYCFTVPAGAQTTSTIFQWAQTGNSGTCCDHWGIDNVEIIANDCNYYYDWTHLPGTPDQASGGQVCPTSTTTYDVIYTNGINDSCTSSVTVNLLLPTVTASANPTTVNCGGCTTLDAVLSNIPPDSCCFTIDMQDSYGDGWNGGSLDVSVNGGATVFGPFSATGTGSLATFCVQGNDSFELIYSSGSWETENTYTLIDPSGNPLFSDGPSPSVGSVYNTTANCGNAPIVWDYNWSGQNVTSPNNSMTTACPNTSGWYYVDVYDLANPTCSATDSVYITTTIASDTILNVQVCGGTSYTFPDGTTQTNITSPITNVSVIQNSFGCDSTITTNISVVNIITNTVTDNVCNGDTYTFPDGTSQVINNFTSYQITYTSVNGCDSIVTYDITPTPTYNLTEAFTVCNGDSHTFPDGTTQTISSSFSYTSNLMTTSGCDSIITTNITMSPTYTLTENVDVCSGDAYTFPDGTNQTNITSNTTYISNLTTANGCDSIITTNVNVFPVYTFVENVSVCNGVTYNFPDATSQVITNPVSHISNLTTANGCDSVITTNVTITPNYTSTEDVIICNGDSYTFPDGTVMNNITTQTTYNSTLSSVNGCDSIVTTNVNLYPVYNITTNVDVCPGTPVTFPDGTSQNVNNNTIYVSNLTSVNGCDSIITTNVNVYNVPPFNVTINGDGCPPNPVTITNNTPGGDCLITVTGPSGMVPYQSCNVTDTFYVSGLYDVNITMVSVDGCQMDTTINDAFNVYPEPVADFNWDPLEGTITDNIITFNNYSIGGDSYSWDFGDGETSNMFSDSHTYEDSGHYQVELIVSNSYGCTDTATGLIIINQEFYIYVPNSFTPDGDEYNNTFKPIITGHDPNSYTLYIFDRWGELVFETHNTEVGWNGVYKGGIKSDVFVWKIKVATFEREKKEFYGHVTVLR